MLDLIRRELIYLTYYFSVQAELIFPYWLTGIVLGSLISVFAKDRIHGLFARLQDTRFGILGIVPATLLGIASPLCMYGTIPLAASFSHKGMREDWLAAFMMSSMLLNPQLLLYSSYLGRTALLVRLLSAVACGVVAGICVRVFYRGRSFFNFSRLEERRSRDIARNPAVRLAANTWRNIKATGPYFLLGVALTAVYQRYVPSGFVAELFGRQHGFGVLMAAALGVPVYVCGGGTIPLIYEWLGNGMSLGAAGAFMISGPATKLTNLGAVKIVVGRRRFLIYLLFVLGLACATGALVDGVGIGPQ